MSIIYEALKKAESYVKGPDQGFNIPKRDRNKFLRIVYILCILIIISLIGFLMGKKPSVSVMPSKILTGSETSLPVKIKPLSITEVEKEKLPIITKDLASLSLTGIIFSDGEYMALINGRMVKPGDFIEGVQIDKIDANGVEVKFKGSSFRLNYP